jgi:hypothetical protein
MGTIYVVRHAQAAFGTDYDRLTQTGFEQARLHGAYFGLRQVRSDAVYYRRYWGPIAGSSLCLQHCRSQHGANGGKLRGWAVPIEGVDSCEAELDQATSALSVISDLASLRALCWVCRKDEDQIKTVRAALRITGARDTSDASARKTRDVWREEIKASHGGHEYRIP